MKLLLLSDQRRSRRFLAWGFGEAPFQLTAAGSRPEVSRSLSADAFHVACLDLKLSAARGRELLATVRREAPHLPVVALVPDAGGPTGSAVLRDQGVSAQLGAPFAVEALRRLLQAHALAEPVGAPRPVVAAAAAHPAVARPVVHDDVARRLLGLAMRAAGSPASILLLGETGTGKTALARAIHEGSPRHAGPFVTVSCPCLGRELLESELFGHVRGAFTGALQDARGKVAAAEGGTLFLDEIGDLPLPLQAKLLRVLQEQEVEPLGSNQVKPLNVRVIAATHIDLEAKVAAGQFRDDLYYRLNVLALRVPPLRERASDIPALIEHLLDDLANRSGLAPLELTDDALALLCAQPWRGNVRELRNLLERAQLALDGRLDGETLRGLLVDPVAPSEPGPVAPVMASPVRTLAEQLAQVERQALQAALTAADGNRQQAAERLGISRAGFYAKLAQHGLGRRG